MHVQLLMLRSPLGIYVPQVLIYNAVNSIRFPGARESWVPSFNRKTQHNSLCPLGKSTSSQCHLWVSLLEHLRRQWVHPSVIPLIDKKI